MQGAGRGRGRGLAPNIVCDYYMCWLLFTHARRRRNVLPGRGARPRDAEARGARGRGAQTWGTDHPQIPFHTVDTPVHCPCPVRNGAWSLEVGTRGRYRHRSDHFLRVPEDRTKQISEYTAQQKHGSRHTTRGITKDELARRARSVPTSSKDRATPSTERCTPARTPQTVRYAAYSSQSTQ